MHVSSLPRRNGDTCNLRPDDGRMSVVGPRLIGAVEAHQARLGRTPRLVAADAAFYSAMNEVAAKAKGVKPVCIPIAPPKALSANANRRSAGSATARNGGPDARDASV
jgi:hypothetical protein